mmetsp:Transcript_2446/g.5790  ORF Transcript_2446/g.5790 Transcript_2446/m.5790 type:complete len:296 (+) Transcript_2446:170-1057(+)
MIVEANSFVMFGRQLSNSGQATSGTNTVIPLKKRKWEHRGSFEAPHEKLEIGRSTYQGAATLRASRRSVEKNVQSFDPYRVSAAPFGGATADSHRTSHELQNGFPVRRTLLDFETRALPPASGASTATLVDIEDNMEMSGETPDNIVDLDCESQSSEHGVGGLGNSQQSAFINAGLLLSKLFGSSNKPSCVKVKGNQTEGYIVNKRFMDVVNKRHERQKLELEQLRRENEALREANRLQSQQFYTPFQQVQHPAFEVPAYFVAGFQPSVAPVCTSEPVGVSTHGACLNSAPPHFL